MTPLLVPPEAAGQRLDAWLAGQQPYLSRARIQSLIREGHVTVNGRTVKPSQKVAAGTTVGIDVPPVAEVGLLPEDIPLDVLYEDADVIVVNKPSGLVVHPAAGHASGTLVNALLHHCRDLAGIGGERRPGIVHRLDKDTSGALVAAKSDAAMAGLMAQFKRRQVEKQYLALVWGCPSPPAGRIETLIGRSAGDRKRMSARPPRGREALTTYEVAESFGATSLLRVHIATGRTHQIRVHLSHLRHPVVGDSQYGMRHPPPLPVPAPRQMLHAERLAFAHPRTGTRVECRAPLPADFAALLKALRA